MGGNGANGKKAENYILASLTFSQIFVILQNEKHGQNGPGENLC